MKNVKVKIDKKLSDDEKEVLERFKCFQQAIIYKDEEILDELMHKDYVLVHMSGKKESKEEFINDLRDNTLNYYESTINNPNITVNRTGAKIIADITLDAKVYGMKGVWTLHSIISLEKDGSSWSVLKWDN